MNGNEYFDRAEFASELVPSNREPLWDATVAGAIATLALAYEQRTANLIAYVDKIDDTSAAIPVVNEIKSRLGITNKAKP